MSTYVLYQDTKRCIGCMSCEVHCKVKNNLPVGPRFCRIVQVGPTMPGGVLKLGFVFMPCYHC